METGRTFRLGSADLFVWKQEGRSAFRFLNQIKNQIIYPLSHKHHI